MTLVLLILLIALPLIFMFGTVYLAYVIPSMAGYKSLGRLLSSILAFGFLYIIIIFVFEEELFSKTDAQELLRKEEITLNRHFELLSYQSEWAIGEDLQLFTLKIDPQDKQQLIKQIKSRDDFNKRLALTNGITGDTIINYYEDSAHYIQETWKPSKKNDYAPTHCFTYISKQDLLLYYENIDD